MARNSGQYPVAGATSVFRSPSRLRIEHLWMLVPVFLVAWMGFMHPLRLLDFWWHLKVGELIVTQGQIPRVDLFSFTHAGQPFIHHDWLAEVLYYLTYRIGGPPLVIAFNTLILLLTFVLIFRLCLKATQRLRAAVLCGLVAAIALGWYSNVRPQVFSFAFFAAFYWILWEYRDRRRDLLWALPPLMALWANLHGAFVLGIALIGLVLAGESVRRLMRGPSADTLTPRALAKLALILALTVLALMVNPEGYRVLAYVRELQVNPSVQRFLREWQVPDIKDIGDLAAFFGPFFLTLLVFFYTRCSLSLTELGLFLTFSLLALGARRHGIWFALVAAPMAARHLNELAISNLLDEIRSRPFLQRLVRRLQSQDAQPERHALNWVILIGLLLFTLILSPWVRPYLKAERLRPQLVEKGTPVGAMDYIAEQRLTGNIFHPQLYGDYLIWRLWPHQRSFFDGRVHLYEESFVRDYVLTFQDPEWESRLARYEVKYLLLPKDDANSRALIEGARNSGNWAELYEDNLSVLFEQQP